MKRFEPRRKRRPCGGCGKQTCCKVANSSAKFDPFFPDSWQANYGGVTETYEAVCWACWNSLLGKAPDRLSLVGRP